MADTSFPQYKKKGYTEQTRSEFLERPYEDVWQDKYANNRVRTASAQPQLPKEQARTPLTSKNSDRGEKHHTDNRRVHKAIWVRKPISILIDHHALLWHTTPSRAGERLIEAGLEQSILQANTNLLVAVLRDTVAQECRAFFARITAILFRIYVLLCQVLHLQKNLLARSGYQKRLTPEDLDKIIAWSKAQAKVDVVKGTRGGDSLDQAIGEWLAAGKPGEDGNGGEKTPRNN
jgi:hypothetical protein